MKIDVMGVRFDNVDMDEALSIAGDLLRRDAVSYVVTPNSEIVYEAMADQGLRDLLNGADLVLPDGAGVVLGSKILKTPLKQKVAGVDFADRLLGLLAENGGTVYLLGSKPGIAELAAEKMLAKHPGLQICGLADGYFKEEGPVIEKINQAKPDVLFVCLGAPKQEKFMAAHQKDLQVKVMIGLGGSLDSFAGTVKRAPKWMIACNLEWFYRLLKEPWRFKRMLRLPKFLWAVVRRRIGGA
ncbi:MAG: WecB/TagA/CpsF family glycosyltransferase [Candidatus Avoscillospira sp.]